MNTIRCFFVAINLVGSLPAATVYWTEWATKTTSGMTGSITLPDSSTVAITYTGDHFFDVSQVAGGGPDFWALGPDDTYESATAENRPPTFGGYTAIGKFTSPHTITFSRPIVNPVLSWMSVNVHGVQFNDPFVVLSSGCGQFGCGTLSSGPNNLLVPAGEGHGTIYLPGTFSSLTFQDVAFEGYRAFTIGVLGVEDNSSSIPEPTSVALLVTGLGGIAWMRRRV